MEEIPEERIPDYFCNANHFPGKYWHPLEVARRTQQEKTSKMSNSELSREENKAVRHVLCKIWRHPEKIAGGVPEINKYGCDAENRCWMRLEDVLDCVIRVTPNVSNRKAVENFVINNRTHMKYWWTNDHISHVTLKEKGEPEFVNGFSAYPGIFKK